MWSGRRQLCRAQRIVASAARWGAREGKSSFFQASICSRRKETRMKLLYRRCAGIDVHQKSVSVCVRRRVKGQPNVEREEAVFGTFTQDLERLGQWLKERKVTQVAMESTGVYWIPVWNILEESALELKLVNPATADVRGSRRRHTEGGVRDPVEPVTLHPIKNLTRSPRFPPVASGVTPSSSAG